MRHGATVAAVSLGMVSAFAAASMAQDARFPPGEWVDRVMSVRSVVAGVPQWSPDGSRLLFAGGLGGGELWTVGSEGGFPRRVAPYPGGAGRTAPPTWSPDGRWIAHVSLRGGSTELWLWSVEDGREVQFTNLGGRINSWSWSPDGRWIAYVEYHNGTHELRVTAVEGGEPRVLVSPELGVVANLDWAPDGKRPSLGFSARVWKHFSSRSR